MKTKKSTSKSLSSSKSKAQENCQTPMRAVILAGGLGKRLRPFTSVIPKPLLPIGEKSVLEIQIEQLRQHQFKEVFLATNYKSNYIKNFFGDGSNLGVKLSISREKKPLGTVGPITLLKDQLQDPFLVMNGDILTLLDYRRLFQFALNIKADLIVAIKEILTPFQFGNIFYKGDFVIGLQEKPKIRTKILAGIYIFKPNIFSIIPENQSFSMNHLIEKMLALKMPIAKYEFSEYWLDIGQVNDYNHAQKIYKKYFKNAKANRIILKNIR